MPCALAMAVRKQVVLEWSKGQTLISICEKHHLSYNTVRRLCQRYRREGSQGLTPHYNCCGRNKTSNPLVKRAAGWLKRLHPGWGGGFIRLILQRRYGKRQVPCERTLQRWFKKAGLYKVKSTFPQPSFPWAVHIHDTWQVDAKEKLRLKSGEKLCYLTVVDEKSGSLLKAFVFPPLSSQ